MRAFIAAEIPEKYKAGLRKLQEELAKEDVKANWVKEFHLTLKFLGEASSVTLKRVKERLKDVLFKEFEMEFTKLGVFPDETFIRVVWVGLKPENKAKKVQSKIDNVLRDMFRPDERFKAHITLGRISSIKNKERFLDVLKSKSIEGSFRVKNFKLIKSNLTENGSIYETLEVYPNEM
ncbi:MAG: RNA 2',3'-cyclic phosphodiesterase [Nanoarchaeota archaeon]|nr:RNA 2',3'-cyclic phosphodiesterase [Nanoarchaeota archaeon]